MRRAGMLLLGFGYMVLGLEAIRIAVAWWNGAIEEPGWEEWLMLASLPILAWIWWRHLSPFGSSGGQCLLPEDRDKAP